MRTWAGGELRLAAPPRPRHSLAEGPQPGRVIPGTECKKINK
jgi:hypothetical protein